HYAIDIRSLKENVGVSEKEYITPQTKVHQAQLMAAEQINELLLKDHHRFTLSQYEGYTWIAQTINSSVIQKNEALTEYKESKSVKRQRLACGIAGGAIAAAFSYYAVEAAITSIALMAGTVLSGGVLLGIMLGVALPVAVLAGIAYYKFSMPLGLFNFFNPTCEEVKETCEQAVSYNNKHNNFKTESDKKLQARIKKKENAIQRLEKDFAQVEERIKNLLKTEQLISEDTIENVQQTVDSYIKRLKELELSCKDCVKFGNRHRLHALKEKSAGLIELQKKFAPHNKAVQERRDRIQYLREEAAVAVAQQKFAPLTEEDVHKRKDHIATEEELNLKELELKMALERVKNLEDENEKLEQGYSALTDQLAMLFGDQPIEEGSSECLAKTPSSFEFSLPPGSPKADAVVKTLDQDNHPLGGVSLLSSGFGLFKRNSEAGILPSATSTRSATSDSLALALMTHNPVPKVEHIIDSFDALFRTSGKTLTAMEEEPVERIERNRSTSFEALPSF
ncbi:MAG TPA: hypothetical protein VN457_02280, partial [Chlamydiales bacterium]|nr:hypothetical protein [Chlamydiales bacterium]